MRTLNPKGLKALRIVHVGVASVWLGGVVMMFALSLSAIGKSTGQAQGAWESLATIDHILRPFVAATLVIGVVFGLWTPWGFVRHRWIVVKWALALATVATSSAIVVSGTRSTIASLSAATDKAVPVAGSGPTTRVIFCLGAQSAALLAALVLSQIKPWGTRRAARPR
jgi:hypothetical protein